MSRKQPKTPRTGLSTSRLRPPQREQAYMLLGIIGDVRVGTSPRPLTVIRLIVFKERLRAAGWSGELP